MLKLDIITLETSLAECSAIVPIVKKQAKETLFSVL